MVWVVWHDPTTQILLRAKDAKSWVRAVSEGQREACSLWQASGRGRYATDRCITLSALGGQGKTHHSKGRADF